MDEINSPLNVLDAPECWGLLATAQVGRLVTRIGDHVDIFPVMFVVDGESVVFRTAEGNKLTELVISSEVLFEADSYTPSHAWSVVVRGTARVLETEAEIQRADSLSLQPKLPTVKRNYVRITANEITGRSFTPGEEPPHD